VPSRYELEVGGRADTAVVTSRWTRLDRGHRRRRLATGRYHHTEDRGRCHQPDCTYIWDWTPDADFA